MWTRGNSPKLCQGCSGWTSGRTSSLKGLSRIETGWPEKYWSQSPSMEALGNNWTWHLVLWFNSHGGAWSKGGLSPGRSFPFLMIL